MNNILKYFLFILGLQLFYVLPASACSLSLGWEDWKPFQYKDNQRLTGLDVELVNKIAEEMKCTLDWQQMPWKRHLTKVESGEVGLAMGASKTPERETYALFTNAYRPEAFHLFIRKDSQIKTIEQLISEGKLIGVMNGYEYGEKIKKLMEAHPKNFSIAYTNEENMRRLAIGRLDAVVKELYEGIAEAKDMKLELIASPEPLTSSEVYIMVSKKSPNSLKTVEKLNAALQAIKDKGLYKQIISSYDK